VPSILLDRTASLVVRGASRMSGFGSQWSLPSKRAISLFAVLIFDIKGFNFKFPGGYSKGM